MACCGKGPRRTMAINARTGAITITEEAAMDTVSIEYVGQKTGGFSVPGPSGRRYRWNPPYATVVDVSREDVQAFLNKGDYQLSGSKRLPPAVTRVTPTSEPIRVRDFQRPAQAAAARATGAPVAPQVVEQVMARGREMTGEQSATPLKTRRPRGKTPGVDDSRTPRWTP